jgi:hypothetical protein
MRWGSAAPRQGRRLSRHPAGVVEGPPEQHLDVSVEASELVGRPARQGIVDRWVDAQQHLFALAAHE